MTQRNLLFISADVKISRQLSDLAAPSIQVVTARPGELPASFQTDAAVAVVIVDHAPSTRIADALRLLEQAGERRPDARRGLLTSYVDVGAIIRAVHTDTAQFVLQRPLVASEVIVALAPLAMLASAGAVRASGAAA